MKISKANRREAIAGVAALASLAATKGIAKQESANETISAAFVLDDLAAKNAETDGPWIQFFDNNTMLSGLYEIPAGGEDSQQPHKIDELYFIVKGVAKLVAGDETYAAKAGSFFFVKASIPHRFIDIKEDLQVIVFFSKADPKGP